MTNALKQQTAAVLFEVIAAARAKGAILILFEEGSRTVLPMAMTDEEACAVQTLARKLQNAMMIDSTLVPNVLN